MVGLYNSNGELRAKYTYDAWGNVISITDENGNAITSATHVGNLNPFRYRGYYQDTETGFYYLMSRYYDTVTHRFVNADGYFTTGLNPLEANMNIYCGNNPVNYSDPSGQKGEPALIISGAFAGANIAKKAAKSSKTFKTPNDAARAFSEQVYSSSLYIRHEYATEIYSYTVNGNVRYNYNTPRAGQPHSGAVGYPTPSGTTIVAYAHTHPNSDVFSSADIIAAHKLNIDAYVVGPNLQLQRYSVSSGAITNLGFVSPEELSDSEKASLVKDFKVSWDSHIAAGCKFDCANMEWPTP